MRRAIEVSSTFTSDIRSYVNKFGHALQHLPSPPLAFPSLTEVENTRFHAFEKNALRTDGRMDQRTDGPTDGRTNGRTHPLIEMRERI